MSLVPADGLYRRRLFHSARRRASRQAMAIRLAVAVTGASVLFWPGTPTRPLVVSLLALAFPGSAASEDETALAMAPVEAPALDKEPVSEPQPAAEPVRIAAVDQAVVSPAVDEPSPAAALTTAVPSVSSEDKPLPPTPAPRPRTRRPQPFVELSYYSDPAAARRGAASLRRLWHHLFADMPLRVVLAEAQGKPIWRVVAGPAGSSDHAAKLCALVQKAGRNCSVAVM